MTTRKLKVVRKAQKRKNRKYVFIPGLNLAGAWLEKAGFEIADFVEIEILNNQLIIKKAN